MPHKYYVAIPEVWYRTIEVEVSDELYDMGTPEESAITLAQIDLDPKEITFDFSHTMDVELWEVEPEEK